MGFLGVGGQGTGHLLGGAWTYIAGGFTGRPDVQVLSVCDVRRSRRESARDRVNAHYTARAGHGYRACDAVVDFREVLARRDIDAVLIATPAHWHATMSVLAVEAGKDVYCEKPTAVTLRESRAVADAVRRTGRVYQAGTQQRSEYSGRFRMACEFVRAGRIGQLREVFCRRAGGTIAWPVAVPDRPALPIPDDLDWDLYLGPAPWIPYDGNAGAHRFDVGELNWGQHHTDIIQWALAADDTGPVEAYVEDLRSALRYANGVVVHGRPHPDEPVGLEGERASSGRRDASPSTATASFRLPAVWCGNRCGPPSPPCPATQATPTTSSPAFAPAPGRSPTPTRPTAPPAPCSSAASPGASGGASAGTRRPRNSREIARRTRSGTS